MTDKVFFIRQASAEAALEWVSAPAPTGGNFSLTAQLEVEKACKTFLEPHRQAPRHEQQFLLIVSVRQPKLR